MHQFPLDPVLRRKWVQFVQRHRAGFNATSKYTSLCSAHFEETCYERCPSLLVNMNLPEGSQQKYFLKKGSIPTRDVVVPPAPKVLSKRRKRQLKRDALSEVTVKKKRKISTQEVTVSARAKESEVIFPAPSISGQDLKLELENLFEGEEALLVSSTSGQSLQFANLSSSVKETMQSLSAAHVESSLSKPAFTPLSSLQASNMCARSEDCVHETKHKNLQTIINRLREKVTKLK
ncbi:hypothetical protein ACROYT_G023798 [Oculina patagonica]